MLPLFEKSELEGKISGMLKCKKNHTAKTNIFFLYEHDLGPLELCLWLSHVECEVWNTKNNNALRDVMLAKKIKYKRMPTRNPHEEIRIVCYLLLSLLGRWLDCKDPNC